MAKSTTPASPQLEEGNSGLFEELTSTRRRPPLPGRWMSDYRRALPQPRLEHLTAEARLIFATRTVLRVLPLIDQANPKTATRVRALVLQIWVRLNKPSSQIDSRMAWASTQEMFLSSPGRVASAAAHTACDLCDTIRRKPSDGIQAEDLRSVLGSYMQCFPSSRTVADPSPKREEDDGRAAVDALSLDLGQLESLDTASHPVGEFDRWVLKVKTLTAPLWTNEPSWWSPEFGWPQLHQLASAATQPGGVTRLQLRAYDDPLEEILFVASQAALLAQLLELRYPPLVGKTGVQHHNHGGDIDLAREVIARHIADPDALAKIIADVPQTVLVALCQVKGNTDAEHHAPKTQFRPRVGEPTPTAAEIEKATKPLSKAQAAAARAILGEVPPENLREFNRQLRAVAGIKLSVAKVKKTLVHKVKVLAGSLNADLVLADDEVNETSHLTQFHFVPVPRGSGQIGLLTAGGDRFKSTEFPQLRALRKGG